MRWVALAGALLLAGCGSTEGTSCIADCAAGIRVEDRFYNTHSQTADRSVLDEPVAEIVGEYCRCGKPPSLQPGQALSMGMDGAVYAVRGYQPSFRVATAGTRRVQVYELANQKAIRTGRDVFELDHITKITVRTPGAKRVIANPQRLDRIVHDIKASSVRPPRRSEARGTVIFGQRDGVRIALPFAPSSRLLDGRVLLSRDLVRELIR